MRSSNSVKIISLDRNSLLAKIHKTAERLRAERDEVVDVRLLGSLARGDYTGTSDADILILLDHSDEADPLQRIITFLPYFDLGRGADLLVYTRAELESRLAANDRFIQGIWSESISI